jgi:ATP-dependent DNA helicase RecG
VKIGKENEILEFKKTTGELNEGIISMSAILNKHGGGELYFGVRNDGTPTGMDISDKTLRDVSQAVGSFLEPKIYPEINEVFFDGKSCIHVAFSGDKAPYLAFGRPYIRVADEDRHMSAAELEKFILKKNAGKDFWDSEWSAKTVKDVDEDVLKQYLGRANRAGRINFTYSTKEEALNKLSVTDGEKLNNAAYILFCGSPMLEVQMAIFAGTERLTFNDIVREGGSVLSLTKTAETYVRNYIRWRVEFDGSLQRKEIPEIPMDAVREAIINSFCHRDFHSSQNNEVAIYKDRVEIYNPGAFPEGLTPQDFITGSERSIPRNPVLAQLMYYAGEIEHFGTGLKRITRECDEIGVKVEFQMLKKGFAVVFYRPDDDYNTAGKNSNEKNDSSINVQTNRESVQINVPINVQINEMERKVLAVIAENPNFTLGEIALKIARTGKTAQRHLDKLRSKGVINRVGSKKDGHWEIIAPVGKELHQ